MAINKLYFTCPDRWFKNEAEFTTWFWKQIKDRWGFFHKISDESSNMKPCDAIFAFDWISWLIEFKYQKTKKCKPFYLLRGSWPSKPWFQVKWLQLNQRNGWLSLVVVYNKNKNMFTVIDFSFLQSNVDYTIWDQDT